MVLLQQTRRPAIKVDGQIFPISGTALSEEEAREVILSSMLPEQEEDFVRHREANYAITTQNCGRFRASAFVQRGQSRLGCAPYTGRNSDN